MGFRIRGGVAHYFFSIPPALEMRQRADGVETGDAIGGGDHGASDGLFDPIGEEAIDGGAPNFEVAIDALTEREGDVEDDRDQMREDEGLVSRLDEAMVRSFVTAWRGSGNRSASMPGADCWKL